MLIIIFLILLSLIMFVFEKINNKKSILSTLLLFTAIVMLVAGNTENADMHIYQYRYQEDSLGVSGYMQWAMSLFGYLCNCMKFSFEFYRFTFYLIGLLLLLLFSFRYVKKYTYLFWVFYLIFTMMIDSTQMKNFMAMVIVVNAIPLLGTKKMKNSILFILLILLAAGFHTAAYVYLPLVIFCNLSIKKKYRVFVFIPIFIFALLFTNKYLSSYLSDFLLTIMDEDLAFRTEKFITKTVNNGYLVYIFATILLICFFYKCDKYAEKSNMDEASKRIVKLSFLCTIYSIAFFPLYIYAQDFSRLLRNFMPLFHIAIVLLIENIAEKDYSITKTYGSTFVSTRRIYTLSFYIVFLIYMFYWDIAIYWETVVEPFFNNNLFY